MGRGYTNHVILSRVRPFRPVNDGDRGAGGGRVDVDPGARFTDHVTHLLKVVDCVSVSLVVVDTGQRRTAQHVRTVQPAALRERVVTSLELARHLCIGSSM